MGSRSATTSDPLRYAAGQLSKRANNEPSSYGLLGRNRSVCGRILTQFFLAFSTGMPFVFEQPNLGKPDETTSTSIRAMDVCSLCLPTRP